MKRCNMKIDVLTLFPELFEAFSAESILGRAQNAGYVTINPVDFRSYSTDKHNSVDEPPFGGGAGMVIGPQPLIDAVADVRTEEASIILLSPQGRKFSQEVAQELAEKEHLILICGHYEGIDERVSMLLGADEVSIGDYVLTGGEPAALVVIDAVTRLIPGVLGNRESASADSFSTGLLEHPHYTRPREFMGNSVPDVLLSGNHKEIELWRHKESLRRTFKRRPDLLNSYSFSEQDRSLIRQIVAEEFDRLEQD
jgi:tRNA (guanine37-N1)-methyltransferase